MSHVQARPGTDTLVFVANYNHKDQISDVLARVKAMQLQLGNRFDIVLIDDHSTDESWKLAENAGYAVVRHAQNSGIGAVIRTGLQYAHDHGYACVGMLSSNGKMLPEELPRLLKPLWDNQADYVQGSRFLAEGKSLGLSRFRSLAIPVFSFVSRLVLHRGFSDITCGYRAYRVDWLFRKPVNLFQAWLDRYELEFYVHYYACKLRLRIVEVPVTIQYTHLAKGGYRSYIRPITGWWSMMRPFVYLGTGLKR